jgi:YfiR/HmsC-like
MARRTRHILLPYWKLWLLLACCGWHGLLWAASASSPSESAVKAAYLHRIAGLVEWPPGSFRGPDATLVIAVSGNDAVAADLEQISTGRPVNGRQVAVRRLREGDPLEGAHVLLVGAGREARVRELASAAGPLLVVTEQESGHQLGGVLNFVLVDGRIRFTASLPQADARGLRLSARLLEVAHAVEGRSR